MNILSSLSSPETHVSVILGFFCLIGFFVLSTIITLGIKARFIAFSKKQESPPPKETERKARTVKPIKSIEINPEEVDRISFKKF